MAQPIPGVPTIADLTGITAVYNKLREIDALIGQLFERIDTSDAMVDERLDRYLRALINMDERFHGLETQMAGASDQILRVANSFDNLKGDVQRVLQLLAEERVSPEARAALDAMETSANRMNDDIDAVSPDPTDTPTDPDQPTG